MQQPIKLQRAQETNKFIPMMIKSAAVLTINLSYLSHGVLEVLTLEA